VYTWKNSIPSFIARAIPADFPPVFFNQRTDHDGCIYLPDYVPVSANLDAKTRIKAKMMYSLPNQKGVIYLVFKAVDSNINRRLGYRGVFTPCLESQIGNSLGLLC
jgi:hypothetical protein